MLEQLIDHSNVSIEKISKAYEIDLIKQMRFNCISMDSHSIMEFIESTCFIRNMPFSENSLTVIYDMIFLMGLVGSGR